ncbi:hypothetical protein BRM9_1645 [Methanobacterium formicicum]|uniref:Uncharacterized protein n=1 Tax=Methanobacterium formicicum TaxID=2162 RepID=A0A089ZEL5_METFO|nr:hypothetical protein [Methanobacterium formicicum]AIS32457.1 hypothetical protein BRM9_1645 [Methanobacterium formicicum]
MGIFNKVSKKELEEKFDYELWLLDLIINEKMFYGDPQLDTVYFRDAGSLSNRSSSLSSTIKLCEDVAEKLLKEIIPLTFVSGFKILDMIFEWILEMNNQTPKSLHWTFEAKIKRIESLDAQLTYPPFFEYNKDIKDHLFNLYKNLKEFRNEVVHNHNFNITDVNTNPILQITSEDKTLVINKDQMKYFVAIVVSIAKILIGKIRFGKNEIIHYKFYLDQIPNLHKSDLFKLKKPILLNVIWVLNSKKNENSVNLDLIRKSLQKYKDYNEREVNFNLWAVSVEDGEIVKAWNFPAEDINQFKIFDLDLNYYNGKLVSLDKLKEFISLKRIIASDNE